MNLSVILRALCTRSSCDVILVSATPRFSQYFHTSSSFNAVDKLVLSKLRKKTGFPLSHCKKAIELHENDLQKAEEWLQKEALTHGWAKAAKLSSRSTSHGLIGVHVNGNVGNFVEVNCETDFVAKNADFQSLVTQVTKEFASISSPNSANLEKPTKVIVDKETLDRMKTNEGKTLSDIVALSIGKIGENIQLTRGVQFVCPADLELVEYAHPPPANEDGLHGKYAAVVAFKNAQDKKLARQLAAHIVGMNPKRIGSLDELEEKEKTESKEEEEDADKKTEGNESSDEEEMKEIASDEETTLVLQTFLSNQDVKVGEVLKENDIHIIDFVRLECGETKVAEN